MIDRLILTPQRRRYRPVALLMALVFSAAGCASGLRTSPDNYPGMANDRTASGGTLLYDVSPPDASGRFVVQAYPANPEGFQVAIAASGTALNSGSHHMLSPAEAVEYARRLRSLIRNRNGEQISSPWKRYREQETRILLSHLPFGDHLVAFHFQIRSRDGDDFLQYIMHVHARYIAGMAQALEVAANMVDGRY